MSESTRHCCRLTYDTCLLQRGTKELEWGMFRSLAAHAHARKLIFTQLCLRNVQTEVKSAVAAIQRMAFVVQTLEPYLFLCQQYRYLTYHVVSNGNALERHAMPTL